MTPAQLAAFERYQSRLTRQAQRDRAKAEAVRARQRETMQRLAAENREKQRRREQARREAESARPKEAAAKITTTARSRSEPFPPVPVRFELPPLGFQDTALPQTDLRQFFLAERAAMWWISNQSDDLLCLPHCRIQPALETAALRRLLGRAIESALAPDLTQVKARQERHLQREIDRINDYFTAYEAELNARSRRSRTPDAQSKLEARVAATRVEREHRCRDQRARHEIRVIPHIDSLLLVAEPAHTCRLTYYLDHATHEADGLFIPRARRWLSVDGRQD